MEITLSQTAAERIQAKGGGSQLICCKTLLEPGCAVEVSVDTRVHRRDLEGYESHWINGVELLTLPELSSHVTNMQIDLRSFLIFRNLRAVVELDNGMIIGKSPYGDSKGGGGGISAVLLLLTQ